MHVKIPTKINHLAVDNSLSIGPVGAEFLATGSKPERCFEGPMGKSKVLLFHCQLTETVNALS